VKANTNRKVKVDGHGSLTVGKYRERDLNARSRWQQTRLVIFLPRLEIFKLISGNSADLLTGQSFGLLRITCDVASRHLPR
jgi:hypothetical protein